MKLSVLSIIFSLFLNTMAFAQGIDRCAFMRVKQTRVEELRNALAAMQELHAERARAREIRDMLVDTADAREVALLAQALEDEASALRADQNLNRNIAIGSGLGSIILAGLLIKRMKATSAGLSTWQNLLAALKNGNKRTIGRILSGTFVVSVAAAFWFNRQRADIADKREFMAQLVEKLDTLKDLSEQIQSISEDLEEEEIAFALRIEQLQSEGFDILGCLGE